MKCIPKNSFNFDAYTMNGLTYKDCQYIAQSRGYMLDNPDKSSGFTAELYCVPNHSLHCLDIYTDDGDLKCRGKKSKFGEAFLEYDGGYYYINYDYINTLKEQNTNV